MNCTFCGDPSIGPCTRKHLEWIIVLPSEIKPKDVFKSPLDGRGYVVLSISRGPDSESYLLQTARRSIGILYPELPVLVRRQVQCYWPRCELHCGKCMLYRESDERQAIIRGEDDPKASAEREQMKKLKRKKEAKDSAPKRRRL